jgi:protein gp37
MSKSPIEWTKGPWNPITGCTKLSAGSLSCYARRMYTWAKVTWADATWKPFKGCTKIGSGCRSCYSRVMAKRLKRETGEA